MKMWNTEQIIKELKKIDGVKITNNGQGGDVDTSNLYVEKNGYSVHIAGFITNGDISNPDSCEVEMVETTDGQDSRGGCNSNDSKDWLLFGQIKETMAKLGFQTVNCMKDYF